MKKLHINSFINFAGHHRPSR